MGVLLFPVSDALTAKYVAVLLGGKNVCFVVKFSAQFGTDWIQLIYI